MTMADHQFMLLQVVHLPRYGRAVVHHSNSRKWVVVTSEHEAEGEGGRDERGGHTQLDDPGAGQAPALHQPAAQERAAAARRHCDHTCTKIRQQHH